MSDALRIGLVAEGPTDGVVIEAALRSILDDRSFVLTQLQPEGSIAFGAMGTGWVGVYRWCKQSARRGGGGLTSDAVVFQNYDVLILHLDADVASGSYAQGSITPDAGDGGLPCAEPCPPASATTDRLRHVLLTWCGEVGVPDKTVLCVPAQSTETWVVAALFPYDVVCGDNLECYGNPEGRLAQQPKAVRIKKHSSDYRSRSADISAAWPRLAGADGLAEARRFDSEARTSIGDNA
jgi:hypothetical protein